MTQPLALDTASCQLTHPLKDSDIDYSAVIPLALTQSTPNTMFGLQRDFENTSTNPILVKEVALVINTASTTPDTQFMIVRAPVTDGAHNYQIVNPGEILRLKVIHATPISGPGIGVNVDVDVAADPLS